MEPIKSGKWFDRKIHWRLSNNALLFIRSLVSLGVRGTVFRMSRCYRLSTRSENTWNVFVELCRWHCCH